MALLSLATVVVDAVAIYVMPDKASYKAAKYDETDAYSRGVLDFDPRSPGGDREPLINQDTATN